MKEISLSSVKLTQYSHGAGCGCKISPKQLTTVLKMSIPQVDSANLIVGNDTRDDAAVYDIGNGQGVISTTDFFLPIVDDPFNFGRIAATNAISDIYAMGGKPIMAIAILGWPINTLSAEIANQVVEGGRAVCKEAGIVLAGGHSIDNPEPLFGLAVTGIVDLKELKRNDTAQAGSKLYLTKPLGVGILSTAQKENKLKAEHAEIASNSMMKLNSVGALISKMKGVSGLTDVTGFGLLGHLLEICESSDVKAVLEYDRIPIFEEAIDYIAQACIPGGTKRNWKSYSEKVKLADDSMQIILSDAQTSGGLLIAVNEEDAPQVEEILKTHDLYAECIGRLTDYSGAEYIEVV